MEAPTVPEVGPSCSADRAALPVSSGPFSSPAQHPSQLLLPPPGPRRSAYCPWCPVSVFHPANLISTMPGLVLAAGDTEIQDSALLASGSSLSSKEVDEHTRQWNKTEHGERVRAWEGEG